MQNAHLVAALVALATALIPALTAVLRYRHNRYRRPPQFESWSTRSVGELTINRLGHAHAATSCVLTPRKFHRFKKVLDVYRFVCARIASAPLGDWPEMICAENPHGSFPGKTATYLIIASTVSGFSFALQSGTLLDWFAVKTEAQHGTQNDVDQ
jgi:hypothetical protein